MVNNFKGLGYSLLPIREDNTISNSRENNIDRYTNRVYEFIVYVLGYSLSYIVST